MQHHLRANLGKDGVYDPTETVETFFRSEDRHLASMEGRAVHACDWARLWQATFHHSQAIAAQWRHSPCCSSPFAHCTPPCWAGRRPARNRFLLVEVTGSAERTKTLTCFCGNTFLGERTCRPSLKRSSTRSHCA